MPKFRYVVKDAKGQTVVDTAESYDKSSLIQQLQGQGFFILKVEEEKLSPAKKASLAQGLQKKRKFGHKRIKLDDMLSFSRQLVTMLESGVTLLRSLEVIRSQIESEKFYHVISQITREVERGKSLSEAVNEHPKVFGQFWVSLVEVGEAGGTLPKVLNKLAFYLEQQAAFRSTIFSAIMYPLVLFFICMGAISFFALFVGPRFEDVFQQMNVELPLITKVLLTSFRVIKTNFLKIVVFIAGIIFLFRKYIKTTVGRKHFEKFLFGLPIVGHIIKLIIVERFASQMALLVESGVPILHALDISERLVDNLTCAKIISEIKESVRQGELLASPMIKSGFFPSMATQMITVGEETGELSKMLNHVAKFYLNTVETFMKRLGTMIEPFMLVFMGGVIGIIVLAMFLPMFNMSQLGGAGGG